MNCHSYFANLQYLCWMVPYRDTLSREEMKLLASTSTRYALTAMNSIYQILALFLLINLTTSQSPTIFQPDTCFR